MAEGGNRLGSTDLRFLPPRRLTVRTGIGVNPRLIHAGRTIAGNRQANSLLVRQLSHYRHVGIFFYFVDSR